MKKLVYILIVFSTLSLTAQEEKDPLRFFPHAVGNRWEYISDDPGSTFVLVRQIQESSSDSLGNVFFTLGNVKYKVQQDGKVYTKAEYYYKDSVFGLEFDFTAPVGAIWRRYNKSTFSGQVLNRYQTFFAGKMRDAIEINLTPATDPEDSTKSIAGWIHVFVEGIGLVGERDSETHRYKWFLKGAVINGDTAGILTSITDAPASKAVVYPSVASDNIIISLTDSDDRILGIVLYNYAGEEIAGLVAGNSDQGSSTLLLNVGAIPEGKYFCRINLGRTSITTPISILR